MGKEKGEREPCTSLLIDHIYTNQPGKITECFVPEVALGDHYTDMLQIVCHWNCVNFHIL